MLWLLFLACDGPDPAQDSGSEEPVVEQEGPRDVRVGVTLDGEPVQGAMVTLGGSNVSQPTDAAGEVVLSVPGVGLPVAIAGHPDARTKGTDVPSDSDAVLIALQRFSRADNEAYPFANPGPPDDRLTNDRCGHCHVTIADDWYDSPHRTAASNPAVLAAYGALQAKLPGETGACADCHAPGIDGVLGGRDLAEASGRASEHGVHCDVCHKVEHVDLDAPAGVAGRLGILRPSEESSVGVESYAWVPLSFGPYGDVPNPRMGAVQRPHFTDGTLCAGCHELWQDPLSGDASADWPDGVPVHTTYSEWRDGPYGDSAPCNTCHMPPDPDVGNSGDLGNLVDAEGVAGGWFRPPGAVRRHTWGGPRTPESRLLQLAGAVELEVVATAEAVDVTATVVNAGAGHYLPTGEPLRQVVLLVEARCDGAVLEPIGGAVIPDEGGWLAEGSVGSQWPGALPGEQVVVLQRSGSRDYDGWGPFAAGVRVAESKGLPNDEVVGVRTIVSMSGDVATFDAPLPLGDRALRLPAPTWPVDGAAPSATAGRPGQLFARVLAGSEGAAGVPHFAATDVRRDNRLAPLAESSSLHRFAGCDGALETRAVLTHRSMPARVSAELGVAAVERVMVEVVR